jgi:hypothetical protein
LRLENLVVANSVTYFVRMSGLENFEINDISFVSDCYGKNQDGLHFGGRVKNGTVKNIRALSTGQTNDDLIALNADDSIVRVENRDLYRDYIENVTFENLFAENCHTIIRILSIDAPIQNIHIKNVYGGYRCYAINGDAARYCRTPLFTEEEKLQALSEAIRVTKKGGIVFAAYCMADASILAYGFVRGQIHNIIQSCMLDAETFETFSKPWDLFELCRKEEIDALRGRFPVTQLHFVATDGYANHMRTTLDGMDEDTFRLFLRYHFATCERVELTGYSNHTLDIFRKDDDFAGVGKAN